VRVPEGRGDGVEMDVLDVLDDEVPPSTVVADPLAVPSTATVTVTQNGSSVVMLGKTVVNETVVGVLVTVCTRVVLRVTVLVVETVAV